MASFRQCIVVKNKSGPPPYLYKLGGLRLAEVIFVIATVKTAASTTCDHESSDVRVTAGGGRSIAGDDVFRPKCSGSA